jgi:long-chain fatty acid transport protein
MDTFVQYNGLEPTQFNEDKVRLHAYNPSGLGTYWQHKNLMMGAGFYAPVGHYFDWEDTVSYGTGTMKGELFQKVGLMAGNISVAKRINDKASIGAGLELLYGETDYDAKKTIAGSGISDYSWALGSQASGLGFEGIIGCLFSITETLNLGAVYRTGSRIKLQGDADTHLTLVASTEKSDFKQRFYHPSTWGLGLVLKPRTNLILTADWQRTNWSESRIDVDYDVEGAVLTDKDYSADWHDSNRYRFGLEYMPSRKWSLRAGYFFDECPLPEKSVSFSNIACIDRQNITFGIGHNWNNDWRLDFIYLYSWGKRKVDGVDYHNKISCFGMSLLHRF